MTKLTQTPKVVTLNSQPLTSPDNLVKNTFGRRKATIADDAEDMVKRWNHMASRVMTVLDLPSKSQNGLTALSTLTQQTVRGEAKPASRRTMGKILKVKGKTPDAKARAVTRRLDSIRRDVARCGRDVMKIIPGSMEPGKKAESPQLVDYFFRDEVCGEAVRRQFNDPRWTWDKTEKGREAREAATADAVAWAIEQLPVSEPIPDKATKDSLPPSFADALKIANSLRERSLNSALEIVEQALLAEGCSQDRITAKLREYFYRDKESGARILESAIKTLPARHPALLEHQTERGGASLSIVQISCPSSPALPRGTPNLPYLAGEPDARFETDFEPNSEMATRDKSVPDAPVTPFVCNTEFSQKPQIDLSGNEAVFEGENDAGQLLPESHEIFLSVRANEQPDTVVLLRDEDKERGIEKRAFPLKGVTWDAVSHLCQQSQRRKQSLCIRPGGDHFLQIDEVTENHLETLGDLPFVVIETSPANFQAWLAFAGTTSREWVREIGKSLIKILPGANIEATGSVRWPGSGNWKPSRGGFVVRIRDYRLGRYVTVAELLEKGLISSAPKPERRATANSYAIDGHFKPDREGWEDCFRRTGDRYHADFEFGLKSASAGISEEDTESILAKVTDPKALTRRNYISQTVTRAYEVHARRREDS